MDLNGCLGVNSIAAKVKQNKSEYSGAMLIVYISMI